MINYRDFNKNRNPWHTQHFFPIQKKLDHTTYWPVFKIFHINFRVCHGFRFLTFIWLKIIFPFSFRFLNKLLKLQPKIINDLLPHLLQQIQKVEQLRGSGRDVKLRNFYEQLQSLCRKWLKKDNLGYFCELKKNLLIKKRPTNCFGLSRKKLTMIKNLLFSFKKLKGY